ncbi:hypothetical protein SUGI_0569710 [Cryptomeria japonica]|nr:hypothetical protein SUGI_0569710 [Cryptomeria japonica]
MLVAYSLGFHAQGSSFYLYESEVDTAWIYPLILPPPSFLIAMEIESSLMATQVRCTGKIRFGRSKFQNFFAFFAVKPTATNTAVEQPNSFCGDMDKLGHQF